MPNMQHEKIRINQIQCKRPMYIVNQEQKYAGIKTAGKL